jgi:tol-pal system protein YbgF
MSIVGIRALATGLLLAAWIAGDAVVAAEPAAGYSSVVPAADAVEPSSVTATESGAGAASNLSRLFYQLQVLQQEVQELRGLVEEQSYHLSRLARDQKEQYIDLDRRLAELATAGPASGSGLPGGSPPGGLPPRVPAGATDPTVGTLPVPGTYPGSPAASPASEREAYTRAFDLMKARQFEESAAAFNQLIAGYPNGQFTANAFYWLGELSLAQSDAEMARQSFAQVLNLYPDHPKVPDTLYKMGVVYHRLGDLSRSIAYFQQVQEEYANSSAAGLAARYMAEIE